MALFEAFKGGLVLLIGMGAISLIHKDVQLFAQDLIRTLHLDPAWRYSALFIKEASKLSDQHLRFLAIGAVIYAIIRFVETYGLWHERPWAEWFAVVSASLYVPIEIYHLAQGFNKERVIIFLVNIIIVVYLARLLYKNHLRKKAGLEPE